MRVATPHLTVRVADESDLGDIRALNHRTFAAEIPQHPRQASGLLVDRLEQDSTFIIARDETGLIGMLALRERRPFSLDAKLPNVDAFLPPGRSACEVRLLAVEPTRRNGVVLRALLKRLVEECDLRGRDIAVLSATTRQLRLYAHLGCVPFGPTVGTEDAQFQPMYITREALVRSAGSALGTDGHAAERAPSVPTPEGEPDCFLTGPVSVSPAVRRRLHDPLRSHRSPEFASDLARIRGGLASLIGARHVALFGGSGTLANDAVAAQIARDRQPVVVCANGEFGDRLLDHARRHGMAVEAVRAPWGEPLDLGRVHETAQRAGAGWIWAVHHETSTGMLNDLPALRGVAMSVGARLAIDAASSVGAVPLSLDGVALASTVSGKALGSVAGLSIVCCADRPAPGGDCVPRYLDLANYLDGDGVPFTQSSLLMGALAEAVAGTDWPARLKAIAQSNRILRERLASDGHEPLVRGAAACPAVATWQVGPCVEAGAMAAQLSAAGFGLSWRSGYLRERRWIQTALMGDFDRERVPAMANALSRQLTASRGAQ